jgi:hypothetical protein
MITRSGEALVTTRRFTTTRIPVKEDEPVSDKKSTLKNRAFFQNYSAAVHFQERVNSVRKTSDLLYLEMRGVFGYTVTWPKG